MRLQACVRLLCGLQVHVNAIDRTAAPVPDQPPASATPPPQADKDKAKAPAAKLWLTGTVLKLPSSATTNNWRKCANLPVQRLPELCQCIAHTLAALEA